MKWSLMHLIACNVRKIFMVILTLVVCLVVPGVGFNNQVNARSAWFDGPDRHAVITVDFTTYEWWLLSWKNSQVLCQLYIEHEGWPDSEEVRHFCGTSLLAQWMSTQPCVFSDTVTSAAQCSGLYLHQASVTPSKRDLKIELDPPDVELSIAGCNPLPPENRCTTLPSLHLEGVEPLPNEMIISIQGFIDNVPFDCPGPSCEIPIGATGSAGVPIQFWANSSYGDSSEIFTARIRVIAQGDFASPEEISSDEPLYFVDILSDKLQGNITSTCSQIWSSFTPVGGAPRWLATPLYVQDLVSSQQYYYLAGSLIEESVVDASACENGGLERGGVANQCGVEIAEPLVKDWQNQFDGEILRIASETGVPAQLMKNIFSQESQFWPGIYGKVSEAGLGHLSDLGADTVLLWNPSFFSQFCPLILSTDACQRGFGNLDLADQEMLRGALVQKVNAACPDCPMGIDLEEANYSISIFARSLLANCEQVGQIIQNATQTKAGEAASYEDLWKFTLTNYNAGSGCLINAIQRTAAMNQQLDWANVSSHLEEGCQGAIAYVDAVSRMPEPAADVLTNTLDEVVIGAQTSDQLVP